MSITIENSQYQKEMMKRHNPTFNNLHQDILFCIFSFLSYIELLRLSRITKKTYNLINSEMFCKQYGEQENIANSLNSYKKSLILHYLGQYQIDEDGNLLHYGIRWNLFEVPDQLTKYHEQFDTVTEVTKEDFSRILFQDIVKIRVPVLTKASATIEFELKPNTPVGLNLKYVLAQVYRKMFNLSEEEKLVDGYGEQVCHENFISGLSFKCFRKIDERTYHLCCEI